MGDNSEQAMHAARIMRDAAETAASAASTASEAARTMQALLEDGYGGNGAMLLEALRKANVTSQAPVTDDDQAALSALRKFSMPFLEGGAACVDDGIALLATQLGLLGPDGKPTRMLTGS